MFVVKPFPECIQEDGVRLVPKMNELLFFTDAMENVLQDSDIPYTVIDVLDIGERVEIVKEKLRECKSAMKFKPTNDLDVYNDRDD